MIMIVKQKADEETLKKVAEDLNGYVKVVVDIQRKILSAGGKLHIEGEKMLLEDGSKQADVWGAGIDFETGEVDFDSVVNLRPKQGNTSREILDPGVRKNVESIINNLLR